MQHQLKSYILAYYIAVFSLFASPALAATRPITFPVDGPASFRNDFSEPRGGGTREHLGIDIMADKMIPAVSAVDGVVSYIVSPQASWGYSITIRDDEGYQYRYLHLNNDTPGTDDGAGGEANAYAPGITRGARVTAGQLIGWVGDSGNAEAVGSHLHFEIRQPDRTPINPYDSLTLAASQSPRSASIKTGVIVPVPEHPPETEQGVAAGAAYIFARDLSEGDTGEAVRQLQMKLKTFGHFTSYITDYFGPITRTAVIRYQNANGLPATGMVGTATRDLLNKDVARALETSAPPVKDLFEGDKGEAVRQLQTQLKALGYYSGTVTDVFDSAVREAVRRFQVTLRLNPTGYVDAGTRKKLGEEFLRLPVIAVPNPPSGYVFTESLALGARGEAVRQLQMKLRTLGYFSADTTGYFGPITRTAVINFQKAMGLEQVGIVGPKTKMALNA
ncbi:MAG: peptidoglycan-binding protein [Patescibacteria group bacterium]